MPKNDIYSERYEKAKRGETFTDLRAAGTDKLTINAIKNMTVMRQMWTLEIISPLLANIVLNELTVG